MDSVNEPYTKYDMWKRRGVYAKIEIVISSYQLRLAATR